ncbi:hypothetical protein ACFE04_019528 [Oxalis oulophora]
MRKISEKKVLCRGYPTEFASYFHYCRALRFDDKPDYAYLKRLFRDLFIREGFQFDYVFDWTILKYQQSQLATPPPRALNENLKFASFRAMRLELVLEFPLLFLALTGEDDGRAAGLSSMDSSRRRLSGQMMNSGNMLKHKAPVLDSPGVSKDAMITGEIPFNIGFLQVATLSLQGNQLSGNIPSIIGLMQALAVLDLSFNNLSGSIPPVLGNLSYAEKLGRQVQMDVCRSTEPDGSEGSFERMVLTKSKNTTLHQQAKGLQWGDLWPC